MSLRAAATRSRLACQTSSGRRRQDVVPDRREAADQLGILAGRAMNHQCRCSLPSPQRQTCTRPMLAEARTARSTRAIITPEVGGELIGQVAGVGVVLARLEQHDDGQPVRLRGQQAPAFVRPDVCLVGLRAAPAVDAALAVARLLGSTGGSSARGRISPSNGNSSHSSTGGIRSASTARAWSCSGVSLIATS